MNLQLYSLKDIKVDAFERPVFASSQGQVLRELRDLIADTKTLFGKHPADFHLYKIGEFDPVSGAIFNHAHGQPEFILSLESLKEVQQ